MNTKIVGVVQKQVFAENDYFVFDFKTLKPYMATKVRGHLCGLVTPLPYGLPLAIKGEWQNHPKFGNQFQLSTWDFAANSESDIHVCLSSFYPNYYTQIPSSVLAKFIREGVPTFFDRLKDLHTGTPEYVEHLAPLAVAYTNLLDSCSLLNQLYACKFSTTDAGIALIFARNHGFAALQKDPYLLASEFSDFGKVERFGTFLKASPQSRLRGLVVHALAHKAPSEGHLYLSRSRLFETVKAADASVSRGIDEALKALIDSGRVVLDGEHHYFEPYFKYEVGSAERLAEFYSMGQHIEVADGTEQQVTEFITDFEASNSIQFSPQQIEALHLFATQRVLVLTGLPGTGKTTVVKAVVNLARKLGLSYTLLAPTGIASERLKHLTGEAAHTIHRALGYDGIGYTGGTGLTEAAVIIIDEMSMVDQELIYRLLNSDGSDDRRWVFVGDAAQLPSVGAGNVLQQLTQMRLGQVNLTSIFRQRYRSDGIVANAHAIHSGQVPTLARDNEEFRFYAIESEDAALNFLCQAAAKLKNRGDNFQIISPKYAGPIGVDAINSALQDELNPDRGQGSFKANDSLFREGDRVMFLKNDYKENVFNGSVGKITRVSSKDVTVNIYHPDGEIQVVTYAKAMVGHILRLAYAVTVHKCQGNEFGTVFLPMFSSHGRMLSRNLLYTAVTRAKTRVIMLGQEAAVVKAISNNTVPQRNTLLKARFEKSWDILQSSPKPPRSAPEEATTEGGPLLGGGPLLSKRVRPSSAIPTGLKTRPSKDSALTAFLESIE